MTAARLALVVLATGPGLAACGVGSSSLGQQVQSWGSSTGFSGTLRQLRADLRRVGSVSTDAAGQRRTVCDVLVTDALAANQQLPTPDHALTALLSLAYGSAAASGRACFSGAPLASAQSGATTASTQLVQAEARYDALTSPLGATP
jgi:hypothetical protein